MRRMIVVIATAFFLLASNAALAQRGRGPRNGRGCCQNCRQSQTCPNPDCKCPACRQTQNQNQNQQQNQEQKPPAPAKK